ncbi:MAG: hypothetical protein RLY42_523 [Pseudomonadota bacterium]|jgi:hypothetical protein
MSYCRISLGAFFTSLSLLTTVAFAGPAEVAELAEIEKIQDNLNLQKDWAKFRLEKKQHDCYDKFFTTRCLEKARLEHRQEIKEIRSQEIPMRERERVLKSIIKDEQDEQRIKERNDSAKAKQRADNVKDYEQKQLDQIKREEDLVKKRADSEKRAQENKKANPL